MIRNLETIDENQRMTLINKFWSGKRVLITGGTAGLGRELAIQLQEYGSRVAVVARTKENLDELKLDYPQIIIVQADIGDKNEIYKISGQVFAQLTEIDVLINNASSLGPTPLSLLLDTECEDFEAVLQTNLLGPFRLIKAILPSMILQESGLIVNISSDAAINAYPTWGSYSVSKAALDHMTRIWQEELKGTGIRFLALDPGDMYTNMHLAAIPDANPDDLYKASDVANSMIEFLAVENSFPLVDVRLSGSSWRDYHE